MALNRMGSYLFCSTRSRLFQQNSTKNIRHFRKSRNSVQPHDEAKVNPGSLETPFSNIHVGVADLSFRRLLKPFVFTVGFSGATFVGCAIWEYENMRAHAVSMLKRPIKYFKRQGDYGLERSNMVVKDIKRWWNSLTPGQKVFAPICAINILVFFAWRIPRLHPFMINYFASNPASPHQCLPMILSTFSHYSGFHLLANMYVLHSFSTGAVHSLGKEQFLALYLSSGVISSFTSYMYKVLRKQPGLSLGASGSIMAILGYVCMQFPETQLGIILLPFFTFSAGAAIKFIVGLDTAGVIMGWKFFDHAAHLGGAAVGIGWALWGNKQVWPQREPILKYWHELRGSIK
ncbi:presenilins-associated rhomboid-like protein, mitochondrial isoform X2 [Anthonomus grandis grandis]|uniref:presenilins-associated rhomboid-like protein, mitochondrial isoform X2 n=1 Tax=Anthonomus grandis grandis TaxID=2921223 RepID=UPI00216608C9|nr:presenilins-associated rhomboid-like protein, mitochondrial isoform X2 [Anthonomus grandis grandis]